MKSVFSILNVIFFVLTISFSAQAEMCNREDITMALEAKVSIKLCMALAGDELVNRCLLGIRIVGLSASTGALLSGIISGIIPVNLSGSLLNDRLKKELIDASQKGLISEGKYRQALNEIKKGFDRLSSKNAKALAGYLQSAGVLSKHGTLAAVKELSAYARALKATGWLLKGGVAGFLLIGSAPSIIDEMTDPNSQIGCMALSERLDGIKKEDVQFVGANPAKNLWGCGHYLKDDFFNLELKTQLNILKRSPMTCRLLKEDYRDLLEIDNPSSNWDGEEELSGGSG